MTKKNKKSGRNTQDKEQNVFSGNEEKRLPINDDQSGSESSEPEEKSNHDVYRTRNLEIEKERD
jgi:hypothetical protein